MNKKCKYEYGGVLNKTCDYEYGANVAGSMFTKMYLKAKLNPNVCVSTGVAWKDIEHGRSRYC